MFGSIGLVEMSVILGVLILIFGPAQLPKLGRSLGQTIKEFRGVGKELTTALDDGLNGPIDTTAKRSDG